MKTFSQFKNNFYSRVTDLSIFDCQDFNVLKIVLDGLKVNYAKRGKYRTLMFSNRLIYSGYLKYKRRSVLGHSTFDRLNTFKGRDYLVIDPGRLKKDENDLFVSSYFYNVYNELSSFVSLSDVSGHPSVFNFSIQELSDDLQFEPLNSNEKVLRRDLIKTFGRIKKSGIFDEQELLNIRIAIDLFFKKYREWDRILKVLCPRKALFVSHYHKEGALLAMKRNGVGAIELQHGLIAPEDIFYMFPHPVKAIRGKALFAEEIWVYGDFWKQRLLQGAEYTEEQIKVFGYYLHENKNIPLSIEEKLKKLKGDKKIILITTQDKHPREISEYISFLSKDLLLKKQEYVIWVKPHPAEKKDAFRSVIKGGNVFILEDNLDYLFRYSDMIVSIYSTTLYDACRYNIPAFSLFAESCADYVHSIVDSGVAKILYSDQNPVELLGALNKKIEPRFYFDTCNYSFLN